MNTIRYKSVVFTRGRDWDLPCGFIKRCVAFAGANHARQNEGKFILSPCFWATLASFRMAAARSTLAHVPTTSSAASNYLVNSAPNDRDGAGANFTPIWCGITFWARTRFY